MLEKPFITLTTDFGLRDPFAGLLKGVILGINPRARIIDITHNIQRHNIFEASQVIGMSYRYFPSGTIHVVVVDPGVGGHRRPLLVSAGHHFFIGPDNGVFSSVYEMSAPDYTVIHLTSSHYFLPMKGSTFHGRDIFAPVAAWLSRGIDYHKFGDPVEDYNRIRLPGVTLTDGKTLKGTIISIDHFGNAISSITGDDLAKLSPGASLHNFRITFKNRALPVADYYAQAEGAGLSALMNSFGYVELFVYGDSAAGKFGIKTGDSVVLSLKKRGRGD